MGDEHAHIDQYVLCARDPPHLRSEGLLGRPFPRLSRAALPHHGVCCAVRFFLFSFLYPQTEMILLRFETAQDGNADETWRENERAAIKRDRALANFADLAPSRSSYPISILEILNKSLISLIPPTHSGPPNYKRHTVHARL